MNIQIGYPEICLVCATVIGSFGLLSPFWVLFTVSVLGSIVRTALKSQHRNEEIQSSKENIDSVKKSISSFFDAVSTPTDKNHTKH